MEKMRQSQALIPEPPKDRDKPVSPKEKDTIIALRKQMLKGVKSMVEGLSPEDAALFDSIKDVLEQKMMDVPNSLAEWATQSQSCALKFDFAVF